MKQAFTKQTQSKTLIMLFAGWGMDAKTLSQVGRKGFDTLVVWDYRETQLDTTQLSDYEEIIIVAWSLGIPFADRFIQQNKHLPITRCVAVAGSLNPINELTGIDPVIYAKTALLPDERALQKFYMRICGGKAAMDALLPQLPERQLSELREELTLIQHHLSENPNESERLGDTTTDIDASRWDAIYICKNDKIFTSENLKRAWSNANRRITELDTEHFPDFNAILETELIDKSSAKESFSSAEKTYSENATLQQRVAASLIEKATRCGFKPQNADVIEIGSGTGLLTILYSNTLSNSNIRLIDLSNKLQTYASNGNQFSLEIEDAELKLRDIESESVDIVFSSSTIQWLHSPLKFLREIHRILRPNGKAFISYFGPGTFAALKEFSRGLPYPVITTADIEQIGFKGVIEEQLIDDKFNNAREALLNLRHTGVNSVNPNRLGAGATRKLMQAITADDGTASLTYNAIYLILSK